MTETCANEKRNHATCDACYNFNPQEKIFGHCDGSVVEDMEYLAWCLEELKDKVVEE
jgi:hypothetical protein